MMQVLELGYRKTEIGMIPVDWEIQKLGALANILGGGTPSSFISSYWNGDINWYTPTEIGKEKYIYESERKITKLGFENCSAKMLPAGTVLLTTRAGIGDVGILLSEGCTNQGFQSFVCSSNIDNEFLYYLISTLKNVFLKNASGSTFLEISPNKIKAIQIALPTLTEQRLIATALSDTDALISSLEKLIAKRKTIKQGTMQQLLTGKKRLAGFSGEWESKKFKDYCWFQEGPGLRNWQFTTNGIKVINVTNLVDGYLNLDRTIRHISLEEFNKMYQHFEIDDKDIVVASSGNSYAKVAVVRKQDLPLVMNTSVIRFKPLYNLDYFFLVAFLKSNLFKDQIDLLITGGAQPNFGPFHLNKVEIKLPPSKEEQSCISKIIHDMDSEIRTLIEKQNKYKSIKQGMMQELLTGKTRLI